MPVDVDPPPVKWAITHSRSVMTSVQVGLSAGAHPFQPMKDWPGSGVAVKVTTSSSGKPARQVDPQEMPSGLLLTVPSPVFATTTPVGCAAGGEALEAALGTRSTTATTVSITIREQPPASGCPRSLMRHANVARRIASRRVTYGSFGPALQRRSVSRPGAPLETRNDRRAGGGCRNARRLTVC